MKMSAFLVHILLAFFLIFSACSTAETKSANAPAEFTADSGKILIVYLSRTNNTKAVAEMIHQKVGGKLVALELQTPYPENYQAIVQQVADENERGYLPPLKTRIDNLEQYDVVFVGFPTWGMQLPPPMKSFLKQYDLSGKAIVPFNTNASYGVGSSLETVKQLCPNSRVLEGFTTKGGIERDGILYVMQGEKEVQVRDEISKWLRKLKLISE